MNYRTYYVELVSKSGGRVVLSFPTYQGACDFYAATCVSPDTNEARMYTTEVVEHSIADYKWNS